MRLRSGLMTDLHESSAAVAPHVGIVGLGEMPVQAGRVELGQAVDLVDV